MKKYSHTGTRHWESFFIFHFQPFGLVSSGLINKEEIWPLSICLKKKRKN